MKKEEYKGLHERAAAFRKGAQIKKVQLRR